MSSAQRLWLQITSGRGPAECQLAVAKLAGVVETAARSAGLACELLDAVAGSERGTLLSALLSVEGEEAVTFARRFEGSALWVCPSPFRPTHKRKNWFVGVDVLNPPSFGKAGATLKESDVLFEAMRASGPGGQHVNKTESAVRATHRPTGLVAVAREERSQAVNKRLALARLAALIAAGVEAAKAGADKDRWAQHGALERGGAKLVFEGPAFKERR